MNTEAIALYEQSIVADPTQMSNYWHLGLALLLQGKEAEAQATWMSAMVEGSLAQIDTWTAELVEILTVAAQKMEAIADLKYALVIRQYIYEFAPENLDNLLFIVWLSVELGLLNEVKVILAEAINQLPKDIEIEKNISSPNKAGVYYNLGIALVSIGDWEKGINYFQKALKVEPNFSDAGLKLGWAKYEIYNKEKGYQFSQDWFSWNIPIWQEYLQKFANLASLHFLEIGSWEGRSTCWLLDNILTHESAEITCIDIFEDNQEGCLKTIEERFDFNIACTGTPEKVKKKIGRSQEVMRTLPLNFYDVLYIDGSHVASDVLTDAVLGWDLVKVGGIIIFDDYGFNLTDQPNQSSKVGVDAFLTAFHDKIKVLHQGYQVIIEKLG
ncbi:MAG: class I SAM-dependent methyltransferase [Phormidium sp.]